MKKTILTKNQYALLSLEMLKIALDERNIKFFSEKANLGIGFFSKNKQKNRENIKSKITFYFMFFVNLAIEYNLLKDKFSREEIEEIKKFCTELCGHALTNDHDSFWIDYQAYTHLYSLIYEVSKDGKKLLLELSVMLMGQLNDKISKQPDIMLDVANRTEKLFDGFSDILDKHQLQK